MDYQFTAKMQEALGHYARDPNRNKVAAYKHAYDCSRMQPQTIAVKASELFKHPLMAQAVSHMQAIAAQSVAIDATWVLERAARLADFNIRKFVRYVDDMPVYDFSKASDDDWYCLTEYVEHTAKLTKGGVYPITEIKLKPGVRKWALEMVGDHTDVQAFRKQVGIGNPDGTPFEPRSLADFYSDEVEGGET